MPTTPWQEQSSESAAGWVSESLEPKGCLGLSGTVLAAAAILVSVGVLAGLWWMSRQREDLLQKKLRLQTVHLEPLVHAEGPIRLGDLHGKVVVLNFWGTWCPPCLMELPHLAELQRKYRAQEGVLFLAVSCGPASPEDPEEIRSQTVAFLANQGFDLPTYLDPGFVTRQAVAQAVGFRGYPTTLVLDRNGYIRKVWVGFDRQMPEQLDQLIQQLLVEAP